MSSNQSMLEQMLQTALAGGGLRQGQGGSAPGGAGNIGEILGGLLGGEATRGIGGGPGQAAPPGSGGLGDILGSILGGLGDAPGGTGPIPGARAGQSGPAQLGSEQQAEMQQAGGLSDLVRYGGMAVIGVLAYQALKRHQAEQGDVQAGEAAAGVPSPDSNFHPAKAPGGADALSGLFVKAMVAATQADGVIDEDEQRRLAGRLDQLGVSSADRRALVQSLTTPVDPRELVSAATSPEIALQIYAASAMAATVDTAAERNYLDRLASGLGINAGLKDQVERAIGRR